jgi:tetratricopeptide (TPR) repeat protein
MVIKRIREAIGKLRERKANEVKEEDKLQSFREAEQMQKAEQIKKEADRLAHLNQYKTAIEEYNKALEICPFSEKDQLFRNTADFLFRTYYNIAASYSFLNKFDMAIEYFDKALGIEPIEDESKVKALMSKGNCYYRAKQLVKGDYEQGAYKISIDSEFDVDGNVVDKFRKLDEKENLLKLALDCFIKTTELDRHNADAWYKKGHMEFLMGNVKETMFSFDNVLMIQKDYTNKEGVSLFDDIKREKGIEVKHSRLLESEMKFKTKTGHFVRNKSEKMIANFLFDNNLLFQYNLAVSWSDKDDFKAAFFIPKIDVYIEHFNFDFIKDYKKLMEWKIKQYEKNKKKLVYTVSEDEKNIEESLKIKLKPYIVL